MQVVPLGSGLVPEHVGQALPGRAVHDQTHLEEHTSVAHLSVQVLDQFEPEPLRLQVEVSAHEPESVALTVPLDGATQHVVRHGARQRAGLEDEVVDGDVPLGEELAVAAEGEAVEHMVVVDHRGHVDRQRGVLQFGRLPEHLHEPGAEVEAAQLRGSHLPVGVDVSALDGQVQGRRVVEQRAGELVQGAVVVPGGGLFQSGQRSRLAERVRSFAAQAAQVGSKVDTTGPARPVELVRERGQAADAGLGGEQQPRAFGHPHRGVPEPRTLPAERIPAERPLRDHALAEPVAGEHRPGAFAHGPDVGDHRPLVVQVQGRGDHGRRRVAADEGGVVEQAERHRHGVPYEVALQGAENRGGVGPRGGRGTGHGDRVLAALQTRAVATGRDQLLFHRGQVLPVQRTGTAHHQPLLQQDQQALGGAERATVVQQVAPGLDGGPALAEGFEVHDPVEVQHLLPDLGPRGLLRLVLGEVLGQPPELQDRVEGVEQLLLIGIRGECGFDQRGPAAGSRDLGRHEQPLEEIPRVSFDRLRGKFGENTGVDRREIAQKRRDGGGGERGAGRRGHDGHRYLLCAGRIGRKRQKGQ